jgi:hypothetical protein
MQPSLMIGVLVFLFSSLVAGCVPIPYQDPYSPEVIGTLIQQGQPMKSTVVTLSLGETCDDPVVDTRTTEEGLFHFDPVYKLQLVHFIIAHRVYTWSVCFSLPDGKIGAWHASLYRMVGTSLALHLQCDATSGLNCKARETFPLEESTELIAPVKPRES